MIMTWQNQVLEALKDKDWHIRESALRALFVTGDTGCAPHLSIFREMAEEDKSAKVRARAAAVVRIVEKFPELPPESPPESPRDKKKKKKGKEPTGPITAEDQLRL